MLHVLTRSIPHGQWRRGAIRCATTHSHWDQPLQLFLSAQPADSEQSRVRTTTTSPEVSELTTWAKLQTHCHSDEVLEELTDAIISDTVTHDPQMRLVLRNFENECPSSVQLNNGNATQILAMLGEALYLQWKHGFPHTPAGWARLSNGFFNYPAGMQPLAASLMIGATLTARSLADKATVGSCETATSSGIRILDPCCGSGTTLIEAQRALHSGYMVTNLVAKDKMFDDSDAAEELQQRRAEGHVASFAQLNECVHSSTIDLCGRDVSPLAVFVATGQTWVPSEQELDDFRTCCEAVAAAARDGDSADLPSVESFGKIRDVLLRMMNKEFETFAGLPKSKYSHSSITGPLWFCYLVAQQRGMPLFSQHSKPSNSKQRRKMRQKKHRQKKLRYKGRWQKQWSEPTSRVQQSKEGALSIFEGVTQAYRAIIQRRGNASDKQVVCRTSDTSISTSVETRCPHCFITFATPQELLEHSTHHCFPDNPGEVLRRFPIGTAVFDAVSVDRVVVVGPATNKSKAHSCVAIQTERGTVVDVPISRLEHKWDSDSKHNFNVEVGQASVLDASSLEDLWSSVDCVVTSPPYPAIYDYLSFARHTRADFDKGTAPSG